MATPSASSSSSSNIMLSIFEKKTTSVELCRPLHNYIAFNYSKHEAQNLEDDLQTQKQYRTNLECMPNPTPIAHRDLLQNYLKAFCLVETCFLISLDKDRVNTVTFTWFDLFKPKQKATQQNIHLEKAAVLFNLGAVYSHIGLTNIAHIQEFSLIFDNFFFLLTNLTNEKTCIHNYNFNDKIAKIITLGMGNFIFYT